VQQPRHAQPDHDGQLRQVGTEQALGMDAGGEHLDERRVA
jgi:hypothetical protein